MLAAISNMSLRRHRHLSAVASLAAALSVVSGQAPAYAQTSLDVTTVPLAQEKPFIPSWQANDDDFLFLKLTIKQYKLTFDVRGYQTDKGVCLDLADVIQSLDLPIRIDKKSRRATGWLFAEDQNFTLDRDSGTVQTVNNTGGPGTAPIAGDIYDTPEGWCVDTDAYSRWFGVDFKPDLYNAVVRLQSERPLPFMEAIERRSRAARLQPKRQAFDLSQYPNANMDYKPWRTPSVDIVAQSAVLSREAAGTDLQGRVELLAAGEALGASYTARFATDAALSPESLRLRAYRNDPEGNLLGPLKATQVAIGDVETVAGRLTGQTAVGRGAFVTNRPLGQMSRFAATTLRGTLPTGWDAELYRNGQLIAFQDDRGDGRYEFIEVDLFFGRNDLEVVLYGPQGQIRREKTSIPVGFNQIEPGQTFYWAGVLENNRDLIQLAQPLGRQPPALRWGLGVERGLDERTSAAIGVQSIFFNDARRTYAEAALARTFGSLQLELAGVHEFGSGGATELNALGRFGDFNFGANALVTFGQFESEFAPREINQRVGLNFNTSLRLGKVRLPIQGAVSRIKRRDGSDVNEFLITASANAGRIALSAQLDHREEVSNRTGGGPPDQRETRIRLLANTRVRNLRLRGNATFITNGPNSGLDTVDVRMDLDLDERSELQGQAEYTGGNDEFRLTGGYTRRFDQLSLRGNAFVTTRGAVGANVQLAFSLGPDPVSGGVRVTESKLARSGQAAVTVFRDDDGNGRRDPGEELLRDVLVEAGLRRTDAVTGENGRAIVDNLSPFRPILVGIDESSLADPYLAPATKGVVVTPRPGVMSELELPISPSGEIEGLLLNPSGVEQPGVKLELLTLDGTPVATTVSEFDGFFLFQRVPYGRYRLQVGVQAAKKLSVVPTIANSDAGTAIEVKRGSDLVRLGPIKLLSQGDTRTGDDPANKPHKDAERAPDAPDIAALKPSDFPVMSIAGLDGSGAE